MTEEGFRFFGVVADITLYGDDTVDNPNFADHENDGFILVEQKVAEVLFRDDDNDDENNNGNENEIENMIDNNDIAVRIALPVLDIDHSNVETTPVNCDMADN